jgi:uncharacterized protein YuzE
MRIRDDPEVDALSVIFRETTVTTQELAEGTVAENDADDRLVGLEILDAESRLGGSSTLREVTLEGVGPTASLGTNPIGDSR